MRGATQLLVMLLGVPVLCSCEQSSLPNTRAELTLGAPNPARPRAQPPVREEVSPALLTAAEGTTPKFSADACGDGMILVEGDYCPEVEQRCKRYLTKYGRYAKYRCAEYA